MTPLVDTGPLIALFDRSDRHHGWARSVFSELRGPLFTCEAVVAEVLFLCTRNRLDPGPLYALLLSGSLRVVPALAEKPQLLVRLLQRYASVPMSVADACLLWLHDELPRSVVLTCDSDFRIYRRNRNRAVEALVPDGI